MRICVFCGSSSGRKRDYAEAAERLAKHLVAERIGIVYGGSNVGLMRTLADTALGLGGEVIGVMPESLVAREVAHGGLTDLRIVRSMHERKALMSELSDAFIAMPGGYGTWEEFCEVLTWTQLGLHKKPCGLLNVAGFYDHLLRMFDYAVTDGFLQPAHRDIAVAESDPARLVERLRRAKVPSVEKWIEREEA